MTYVVEVDRFLHGSPWGLVAPWSTKEEHTVEAFLRRTVEEVACSLNLSERSEYNHYGSGYASYVDAWFYREDSSFKIGKGFRYTGLVVLISRLTNVFSLGEGTKSWQPGRGGASSSYLPSLDLVDQFQHLCVEETAGEVENFLGDKGLVRLRREDLSEPLCSTTVIPTILSDPPWRLFDAVYYWED